jgi:hypothetical protein
MCWEEETSEANLSSSICQTAVVVAGSKLDKKRLTVRIGLEDTVEA